MKFKRKRKREKKAREPYVRLVGRLHGVDVWGIECPRCRQAARLAFLGTRTYFKDLAEEEARAHARACPSLSPRQRKSLGDIT